MTITIFEKLNKSQQNNKTSKNDNISKHYKSYIK